MPAAKSLAAPSVIVPGWSVYRKWRHAIATVLSTVIVLAFCDRPVDAVATLVVSATSRPLLGLSLDSGPPGPSASLYLTGGSQAASPPPEAPPAEPPSGAIDFGAESPQEVGGREKPVDLRIWSNCGYKVTMSRTEYRAINLRYMGVDVSGTADGGSFITLSAPEGIGATGFDADPSRSALAAPLAGRGLPLSALPSGPAGEQSPTLVSGDRASRRGPLFGPSNALRVRLMVACARSPDLVPADSALAGTFEAKVEFRIFPNN